MTIRQLVIETGRREKLIRAYIAEYMPEIYKKKGKIEFSEYHYNKIKELLDNLTINEFAYKYKYTFYVVAKHIRDHYHDIEKYHGKAVINKKYEIAILQTIKKHFGEKAGSTSSLYHGSNICDTCYYYHDEKCEFGLKTCEKERYINRDGR